MSKGFKKEDKFNNTLGQDIKEYLTGYEETCRDYQLIEEQTLWFFYSIFDGEPKRFFREHILQ